MRAAIYFVSMCLLAGYVSSEFAWRVGQDYKYDVRGRLMTGIKQIANQNTGLEITYRMTIRRTGPNTILLNPSNYRTVETNEDIEGGWRDGDFSQGGQVHIQPELLKYLEAPMEAKYVRGLIVSLVIPGGMPTWAENIKRAQASHWILDSTGANVVLEGNINRNTNTLRTQESQDDMSGYFYETLEQTVQGECETYYTVSQTGPMGSVFQLQAQGQPKVSGDVQSQEQSSSSSEEEQQQNDKNKNNHHHSGEQSDEVYQQGELPWPRAFQTLCKPNDQIYEVVKHVNFTRCTQKAVFAHITPSEFLKCRPGDNKCGSDMARVMETRFLLCGTSRTSFTILKVEQDERFSFGLNKQHTVFGGIVYNTTLNSITPISESRNVQIQNPRTLDNLVYTFDPREQKLQKEGQLPIATGSDNDQHNRRIPKTQSQSSEEQNQQADQPRRRYNDDLLNSQQSGETVEPIKDPRVFNVRNQLPLPSLKQAPLNPFLISPLTRDQFQTRIRELLNLVYRACGSQTQREPIAETETLSNLAVIAKVVRFMGYEDILRVYQVVKEQNQGQEKTIKLNFLMDCIAIAGTNPAILVINRLIESEEVTGEKAAQLAMTYPAYIRHPTPELLNQIDQLIQSGVVEKQPQVKNTLVLAFSNILFQACMNSRIKQSRYPVAQYGEFCSEELVRSKYAPRFVDEVKRNVHVEGQQAKKAATLYLMALGNLGTPSAIPVVQEILDRSQDPYIKTEAIYALKRLVVSKDAQNRNIENGKIVDRMAKDPVTDVLVEKKVLPLLVSVAFDQTEHHSVRIAAIQLLTYCTYADVVIWQKLATSTWYEKSQEVKSFVYSTIKGWATLQRPLRNLHWRIQQRASAVLSLVNPFLQGLAKSKNFVHANVADHLASGEFFQIAYTGSRDSNIPNNMYFRNYLQFGTAGLGINAFEGSIHGRSISKLVDAFIDQVANKRPDERNAHPELAEIRNLLGIEKRQMHERPHGALYFKIRNEMSRLFQVSVEDIETQWQKMKVDAFINLKRGINTNYQKVVELAEHSIEMATSMGIPMIYHYRQPMMLSLRGEVKLLTNGIISMKDAQLLGHLHPIYAWKTHAKIGLKVPFTGKKYQAGVQRHFAMEVPFRFTVRRAESKQIVVALSPMQLHQERPQGKIELVSYHQIPYTAVVTDELYPTIHPKGGKMEIVRSEGLNEGFEYRQTQGQDALGFALTLEEKSDYRQEKESVAGWARFIQKFNGPISFFNLGWLGTRPIKFAQRKIILDLDRSQASTLVFAVGAKRQDGFVEEWTPQNLSGSSSSSSESVETTSRRPHRHSGSNSVEDENRRRYSRKVSGPLIDLGSDSSESSSKEQSRNQNEQTTLANARQRSVIVVLVAKKHALPSVQQTSSIVKVLESGENLVQYVALYKSQNGRVWFRLAAGEPANHATESFRSSTSSSSIKAVVEAILRSPNDKKQFDGCIEFKGKYEAPQKASQDILVVLRKTLLNTPLEAVANGELRFGKSCKDLEYNVQMEAKLRRGEKQARWASTQSPQAKQCAEDEKKGFYSSQVCLWVADNQAAVLNRMNLRFKVNKQLPDVVRNVTRKFEDAVRYSYYFAHSSNIVPEGSQELTAKSDSLEIKLNFAPDGQFADVEVLKPKTRWELNSIKLNRVLKSFLPLRSTLSVVDTIRQKVLKNDAQRTCSVESKFISTFDNVTATFRRGVASSGCYTLLAADCSGRLPMAVLAKDIGSGQQKVRMLLGGTTKIDITSSGGSSMTRSRFLVKINGQEKRLPYIQRSFEVPKEGEQRDTQYIAKVVEMPNEGVQVLTKTIQVAYDGTRIVIFSHPDYHNTTCGICGNNDGEKVADMRSPKNLPLSRGTLLVASYSYSSHDDSDKCEIDSKIKREIQQEEQIGLNFRSYSRNFLQAPAQQHWQQQQQQEQQEQQQQQSWFQDQNPQQNGGRRHYG